MDPNRFRAPRRTYLLPIAGAFLLTWGRPLATEYALASIQPDDLQWFIVVSAWFLVGIGLGALLHDIKSRDSWIAHDIRVWRRMFVLELAIFAHDSTPAIEWHQLKVRVRFMRHCNASLSVRVRYLAGTPRAQSFVLDEACSPKQTRERDAVLNIVLATFPIKAYDGQPPGNPAWGAKLRRAPEDHQGMIPLSEGTESVIEVSVRTWRGVQTEQVILFWPRQMGDGGKAAVIESNLLTILSEDS